MPDFDPMMSDELPPMNATREEAEKVARSMPVGFGLIEISALISIVYYAFQLWKACSGRQSYEKLYAGGTQHRPDDIRRAAKQIRRAARHHDQMLSRMDAETLAIAGLDHLVAMEPERMKACCSESFESEYNEVMAFTPDEE